MVWLLRKPSQSSASRCGHRFSVLFAIVFAAAATFSSVATAQHDEQLQRLIEDATRGFRGDVGIYVEHLPTGRRADLNSDDLFPSASLIKVPIMVNVFDHMQKGKLKMNQSFTFSDSLRTPGAGFLGGFRDGEPVTVQEMLELMMAASDNSAALWLQHLSGGGETINRWLERNGYVSTRVNAGTPGRLDQWKKFNWGQTSPAEIASLLVAIADDRVVSSEASEKMYRLMSRSFVDTEALAMIPPKVQTISKQASIKNSRSEVILVNPPHGSYVLAILTKNIKDTSWDEDNEAFELIRNVSHVVWEYFEKDYAWKAPQRRSVD